MEKLIKKKNMDLNNNVFVLSSANCLRDFYGILSEEQKQVLKFRFIMYLDAKYYEGKYIPTKEQYYKDISCVYTEQNFNRMQQCLNSGKFMEPHVNVFSIIWLHIFRSYLNDLGLLLQQQ